MIDNLRDFLGHIGVALNADPSVDIDIVADASLQKGYRSQYNIVIGQFYSNAFPFTEELWRFLYDHKDDISTYPAAIISAAKPSQAVNPGRYYLTELQMIRRHQEGRR